MGGSRYTQQPSQTAICNPVLTNPLPLAGIVVASDAYRSYPAAKALPLVGVLAVDETFLTSRGGDAERGATVGPSLALELPLADMVLGRFGRGDVDSDGGWWLVVGSGGGGVLGMAVAKGSKGESSFNMLLSACYYSIVSHLSSLHRHSDISRSPLIQSSPLRNTP